MVPIEQHDPTKKYWYAGMVIDLVHMPFVIVLLLFGKNVIGSTAFTIIVTAIVVLQVATLGCPCVAASAALKRRHDPSYRPHWSFNRVAVREVRRARRGTHLYCPHDRRIHAGPAIHLSPHHRREPEPELSVGD